MKRAFILIFVVLVAAGCKNAAREPDSGSPKVSGDTISFPAASPQVAALTIAKAQAGAPIPATLTGRLVWDEDRTARLYPAFAGKVVKILVKPGDRVQAGQALALLASPDFGQAQSDAHRSAADSALADKNVTRARALYEHGVIAQKDLQAAEADYQKAQAELHRTQARLTLYGGGDSVDQRFALSSPITGIVVERNINPGQELRTDMMTNNAPAMFVVTDPARLWVQLDASEKDLAFVHKGATVPLQSPAYPGEIFPARLDTVSDFVDPTTRAIKVRGTVDNVARKLKGEMFVTAEVPRTTADALQVPATATYLLGSQNYVFVSTGPGSFVRRQIVVGSSQGSTIVVLSGLKEGEMVVTGGNLLLQQLLANAPAK